MIKESGNHLILCLLLTRQSTHTRAHTHTRTYAHIKLTTFSYSVVLAPKARAYGTEKVV